MKVLKKILNLWPVILTLLVVAWCIACILGGALEKDDFFVGAFFFDLLLPLCAFFTGLWYSPQIKSRKKWIIPVAFGIIQIILFSFPFGYLGFGYIVTALLEGIQIAICTVAGILLGKYISDYRNGNRKKFSIVERIVLNILNFILIGIISITVVFGALYVTAAINMGYEIIEEIIEDKPEYQNELPPLWNAIEKFEVPAGYVTESTGSNETYENILRNNNKDEQVLMTVSLEDYKGLNKVKLRDIVRFSIYEDASKKKAQKWIDSAKVETINGIKIYRHDKNVILNKNGTYIYATLEPGTLIPTEKDKEVFNQIVNSIQIK